MRLKKKNKNKKRGRLEASRCQGQTVVRERHRAKLDGNSAKRLVASAICNREDPHLDTVYMASLSFFIDYKSSMVCRFQRRCSSTNVRFRKFESSNLRSELALAASAVLSGRVSENSCSECMIGNDSVASGLSFA